MHGSCVWAGREGASAWLGVQGSVAPFHNTPACSATTPATPPIWPPPGHCGLHQEAHRVARGQGQRRVRRARRVGRQEQRGGGGGAARGGHAGRPGRGRGTGAGRWQAGARGCDHVFQRGRVRHECVGCSPSGASCRLCTHPFSARSALLALAARCAHRPYLPHLGPRSPARAPGPADCGDGVGDVVQAVPRVPGQVRGGGGALPRRNLPQVLRCACAVAGRTHGAQQGGSGGGAAAAASEGAS